MKRSLRIITGLVAGGFVSLASVLAAGIDHFNVTMTPDTINAGESVDLIIEAVDRNDATVTDYTGTILIFSESDDEAKLPSALEQNTYTFMTSDQGVVKFENAVTFSAEGPQSIHIYDLDDTEVIGVGEVTVEKQQEAEVITIEILSPENGLTIGENSIKISGITQKNHKIEILVNEKNPVTTISNNDGVFEKQVDTLVNGENTIIAHVLNADEEKVGTSNEVSVKVESIAPTFKSVKTNPQEVIQGETYSVEVVASKELTNVNVVVNDTVHNLEETEQGVYTAKIYAPEIPDTYKIDVMLKDELGLETKELGAGSITVNQKPQPIEEPKEELNTAAEKVIDYSIKNLKVTQLKSKSVLTWDAVETVESYEVYKKLEGEQTELITTVNEPRFEVEITGEEMKYDYFAVKAIAKTGSGEIIPTDLSEMTKVQTGPELIILLLLSILIGGFFFMNQKRA